MGELGNIVMDVYMGAKFVLPLKMELRGASNVMAYL
jgi:hypothetical protein